MSPTPHNVGGAHLPRRGAPSCFLTRRLVYGGRPALDEAERLKTSAFRDMRNRGALLRAIPFTLAIGIIAAGLTISAAKAAGESYDPAAVTSALCRGYAASEHALPFDTMYAQCMYARGYIVPGFSPSPNSPGYQGELPGPGAIGGGH